MYHNNVKEITKIQIIRVCIAMFVATVCFYEHFVRFKIDTF